MVIACEKFKVVWSKLDHYIISLISMHLEWKRWQNQHTWPFLLVGPSLAKQGLKPFESILRHQTKFLFWGGALSFWCCTFSCYSTHEDISNDVRYWSLYAKVMALRSWPSCFHTYSLGECCFKPIIHGKGASHVHVI